MGNDAYDRALSQNAIKTGGIVNTNAMTSAMLAKNAYNAELAKAGVVDLADYKPKKPTNKIDIFGREFYENEKVIIKDPDNPELGEQEITIKELLSILNK